MSGHRPERLKFFVCILAIKIWILFGIWFLKFRLKFI
jgi:hypothetical protein